MGAYPRRGRHRRPTLRALMLVGVSCFALGALCHQWISLRRVTPSSISTSGGSGDTTAAAEKRAIAAPRVEHREKSLLRHRRDHRSGGADALRSSSRLRALGYPACPWMQRPREIRYPRIPVSAGQRHAGVHRIVRCISSIQHAQDSGTIFIGLDGGTNLGAAAAGGFHGHFADDSDLDLFRVLHATDQESLRDRRVFAKRHGFPSRRMCGRDTHISGPWAVTNLAHIQRKEQLEQYLPYGPRRMGHQKRVCRGEFEGIEVLVSDAGYLEWIYGASWWVPVPHLGMKDLGISGLSNWMQPRHHFFRFLGWWRDSLESLQSVDVRPKDGRISRSEFAQFVHGHPQVNQLWLAHAVRSEPCVVENARIHYDHALHYLELGFRLRKRCKGGGIARGENYMQKGWERDMKCHVENSKTYGREWKAPASQNLPLRGVVSDDMRCGGNVWRKLIAAK